MSHIVLLGDSIFDNAAYVPDRPPVEEQVRRTLPAGWKVTLLALDGDTTEGIGAQMLRLPPDATHLFVSIGGNDALSGSWILGQRVHSVDEALRLLEDLRTAFAERYRAMLELVRSPGKPVTVCTVYDRVPGLSAAERAALAGFNEIILREAAMAGLDVIDLRLVCDRDSDFSHVSPIEPSESGGFKIARVIARAVTSQRADGQTCAIFA